MAKSHPNKAKWPAVRLRLARKESVRGYLLRKFKHDEEHLFKKVRAFINGSEAVTSGFDFENSSAAYFEKSSAAYGFDFGGLKAANDSPTQAYEGFDFGG
eukprot:3044182-Amphidinium_carterae.1